VDPVIWEPLHFVKFYLQEHNWVITVNSEEKFLHASSKGEEKRKLYTILKVCSAQEKLVNPRLTS
jgi:hypothetical protein